MKKLLEYLLVIVLLSPLLFINIRDSHDWGDDFAGYLRQAENISQGKPFYQSGFEFHDYNTRYSPPYYSYGFPLLLAPVVKVWGLDFKALDRYMSLWVLAWALLIFWYLRRSFSFFTTLSFILIFFLNPWFFDLKTNVLSDVPFSFFFLLSLLLYLHRGSKSIHYQVFTGFVFAFMIGIRSVGIIMLPLILIELGARCLSFLFGSISKEDVKGEVSGTAMVLLLTAAFAFFFSDLLFRAPADLTGHFIGLFKYRQYYDVVLKNLDVYTTEFNNLFHHDAGKYSFAIQYTSAFMLVLLVIGFVNSIFSRHRFELAVMVVFCIVVVLFPYSNQGFRYLLPVLPILMYFIITGARSIQIAPGLSRYVLATVFVIFILLQYRKEIDGMREDQGSPIWPGPFTEDNRKAFDYLRSAIPDGAVVACLKPRALELLTDRRSCVLPAGDDIAGIAAKLSIAKPAYLLSINELGPKVDYVAAYRGDSLIWQNNACRLYLCHHNQNNN